MPFWIEGWVEVSRSPERDGEHLWFGVIQLDALIHAADEVSEALFGLSKACLKGEKIVPALAADRGTPSNPSGAVSETLTRIKEHEAISGPGEFGGYTHATWAEVRSHKLDAEALDKSDWKVIFELARKLEQTFKPDRIRFVVWFNW